MLNLFGRLVTGTGRMWFIFLHFFKHIRTVPVSWLAQSVPIHADPEVRCFSKEKTSPLEHDNWHVSKYFVLSAYHKHLYMHHFDNRWIFCNRLPDCHLYFVHMSIILRCTHTISTGIRTSVTICAKKGHSILSFITYFCHINTLHFIWSPMIAPPW
jgi:hypothetical protein